MDKKQQAIADLVSANHILAHFGIVDSFGHVSIRCPENPEHFLLSRHKAPASIAAEDILTLDMDGETVGDDRRSYLERFIHSEIYRERPDVMAVVHNHSPSVIPFGVVATQPLRPIYHMAAGAGKHVPLFDIETERGDATDMLIRDRELGSALARKLGDNSIVLMRGHGVTVAATSLKWVVFNAYYLEWNARLQLQALQLGPVKYLSDGEIDSASATNLSAVDRAWDYWLRLISPDGS